MQDSVFLRAVGGRVGGEGALQKLPHISMFILLSRM